MANDAHVKVNLHVVKLEDMTDEEKAKFKNSVAMVSSKTVREVTAKAIQKLLGEFPFVDGSLLNEFGEYMTGDTSQATHSDNSTDSSQGLDDDLIDAMSTALPPQPQPKPDDWQIRFDWRRNLSPFFGQPTVQPMPYTHNPWRDEYSYGDNRGYDRNEPFDFQNQLERFINSFPYLAAAYKIIKVMDASRAASWGEPHVIVVFETADDRTLEVHVKLQQSYIALNPRDVLYFTRSGILEQVEKDYAAMTRRINEASILDGEDGEATKREFTDRDYFDAHGTLGVAPIAILKGDVVKYCPKCGIVGVERNGQIVYQNDRHDVKEG